MNEIQEKLWEGMLCFNRKSYEESKLFFTDVLDWDSGNPEANYYLGLIYMKEENYTKAVVYLKSIVDMSVNFIFTHQCRMLLGVIYYRTQEWERAKAEFQKLLKVNFEPAKVHAALASVYYKLEDYENALDEAFKAHKADPYNLNAKNTYGFLLCDLDIDAEKGVEVLRDVVRLKPENPAYLDSLAWGLYKKGDIKESIDNFKAAMHLTSNEEIQEHYNIVIGVKAAPVRNRV